MKKEMKSMLKYFKRMSLGTIVLILLAAVFVPSALGLNQYLPEALKEKFGRDITLDLRDMDIIDVFKFLSLKGDFSIVISKTVAGRATLVLKNVKIGDALDIIAIANGLGYKAIENIVYVMPEEEYFQMFGTYFRDKTKVKIVHLNYVRPSYALEALKNIKSEVGKLVIDEDTGTIIMIDTEDKLFEMQDALGKIDHSLETKVYNLNYAKAEIVKEKLRERLDVKSVGSIESDERSNQVIITALPERFNEIEPLVLALDKKTKEVMIRLKILKLVLNPKFDFGIDWSRAFEKSKNAALKSLVFTGAFPISTAVSTAAELGTVGRIALGNVNSDDAEFEIKALKQISDVKTLANPTLLVTNNEEAKIHIGDKLAYVTTTTTGTGADQTTNEEVHFLDVGILLTVTPTISDDGSVRLKIKPEISSKTNDLVTPQGAKIPLINTTLVETSVMVKDGMTVIIGGLHKDEQQTTKQGLPFLMDLPVIGSAFKNVSDTVTKTEIVIILTPEIIDGDSTNTGYAPTMAPMQDY